MENILFTAHALSDPRPSQPPIISISQYRVIFIQLFISFISQTNLIGLRVHKTLCRKQKLFSLRLT